MKVLIFTLLALAVSADNYGYSSYPSYSSYSSYPSSYGSGYGSSLYGSSYGSGISYGLGGAGQSYYGGNVGGYAYKPSVYQTARYSYIYPYGTAEAYRTGSYGHSTSEGPAKIVYTQDFSGIEGHPGYQLGTPVIAGVEKYIVDPVHTSAFGNRAGSWHRADNQGETVAGDLSGVQFAQEVAGIGAKDFENAALVGTGYDGIKGAASPKVPMGSFIESGVGKSGAQGSSTSGGGHSQISSVRDSSKSTGHSGGVAAKTTAHSFDKLSPQRTVATEPKHTSGQTFGTTRKTGTQDVRQIGEVSFIQGHGAISGHTGHRVAGQKPAVAPFDKTTTGALPSAKQSSGYAHRAGSVYKTAPHGFSTAAGPQISFILGGTELFQQGGYRHTSINRLTAPALPATRKHSSGYVQRTGSIPKSEAYGTSAGAGPQITFIRGQTAQRQPDPKQVAAIAPKPVISHDSAAWRKTQAQGISDVGQDGETIFAQDISAVSGQRVSGAKPALVSLDKLATGGVSGGSQKHSSGYQRVAGAILKNTAQGFSAASGPSHISFIQDFSKVSGHQAAAIKPEIPTLDEFRIPAFPGATDSQGYQSRPINKASFASKSTRGSSAAPKQPAVSQRAFTELDGQSPADALYYGSAEGHRAADKSSYIGGPATGFSDGYAVNYKHNTAFGEGITNDKLSSFIVVPETTFTNDKSSVSKYSFPDKGVASGGIQHSSTVFSGTGDAATSYKVSSEDDSVDKSKLYVAVPAENYDEEKSSIFLHSSGVAPTGTFVEENGSFFQLSPQSADSGVATHDRYESQIPVL